MRKFTFDDGIEGVEYETLDELIEAGIYLIFEDNDHYYVRLNEDNSGYNDCMYKVDKDSHRASYMSRIDFMLDIEENANPVDLETLRKRVS